MCNHMFHASGRPIFIFHLFTTVLSLALSVSRSVQQGKCTSFRRAFGLASHAERENWPFLQKSNQNKTNNNNKKTVHQVSQTSAFEIRSTISALKLLSCNITKVETHSSQREGGRRGGDGEIGDLSCQSKKTKQNKTKNHQVTHFKKNQFAVKKQTNKKTNNNNKNG